MFCYFNDEISELLYEKEFFTLMMVTDMKETLEIVNLKEKELSIVITVIEEWEIIQIMNQ